MAGQTDKAVLGEMLVVRHEPGRGDAHVAQQRVSAAHGARYLD